MLDAETRAGLRDRRTEHELTADALRKLTGREWQPPRRGRGRPPGEFGARDSAIFRAVSALIDRGLSQRRAFAIVASELALARRTIEPKTVESAFRAERTRRLENGKALLRRMGWDPDAPDFPARFAAALERCNQANRFFQAP